MEEATALCQKASIVILNYDGQSYLAQFLPSVIAHSQGARVIVADNFSTDHSLAFLKDHFPEVEIIAFEKNLGFCGGYNAALAQIDTPYFVLLNSDVEVTRGWLPPLLNMLEQNTSMAACQPKIKAFHQKSSFEYAGAAGGYIDAFGYPFARGRVFDTLEEDNGQYDNDTAVFWASGACMAIKANLFRQLGGFDTSFFAHMEEIDLCWRLQNAGYTIGFTGACEVFHVGGGTLPKTNPRKTFLNFRNSLAVLVKNLPAYQVLPLVFVRLLLDGVAALQFGVKGQWKNLIAILSAHFSFYGMLPDLWKQRRASKTKSFRRFHPGVYKGSIVAAYFLFGIRHFSSLKGKKFV